jgi:hypothetical protein
MKFGLMAALWLLVFSMAVQLFEAYGLLDGSVLDGLLGTASHYLGSGEQAMHFFEPRQQ